MTQHISFQSEENRDRAHRQWEEEVRQKAIQVIRAYGVTLKMDRVWREARFVLRFSLPRGTAGLLVCSLLLPPRNGRVTIAISTRPALVRLRPSLGQMAKDLRLLLGDNTRVDLASFDSLLKHST